MIGVVAPYSSLPHPQGDMLGRTNEPDLVFRGRHFSQAQVLPLMIASQDGTVIRSLGLVVSVLAREAEGMHFTQEEFFKCCQCRISMFQHCVLS